MSGTRSSERGNVLTMVLVGIIILLSTVNAAAVTLAIMNKEQYLPPAPPPQPVAAEDTSDDGRLLANQTREDDAILVADAVAGFFSNNIGIYPTAFSGGSLTAGGISKPQQVQLSYYRQVTVVSGPQKPIEGDNVRLVTKASCADKGVTIAPKSTSYTYVVQYTAQTKAGGIDALCYTPQS
jgi:hypothetical protein